jgi:TIR domain
MAGRRLENWDFFIAYSSRDGERAGALRRRLIRTGARVFRDREGLAVGAPWGEALKTALARSRRTVVLISRHSRKAHYQQEEIAIAILLVRQKPRAYRVLPVLLEGGRLTDVPYGLLSLTLLREDQLGLDGVARALLTSLKEPSPTSGPASLGRSVAILDQVWSEVEPVLLDKPHRVPEQFRVRYLTEGQDLVMRDHGKELKRITRGQFERKLTSDQLDYVETLERSMEVNRALWKREYPRRSLNRTSKSGVKKAVAAMAQDLEGVLRMLTTAGFWLDDHYESVRGIVTNPALRSLSGS